MRYPAIPIVCGILLAALLICAACTLPGGKGTPVPTTIPAPVSTPSLTTVPASTSPSAPANTPASTTMPALSATLLPVRSPALSSGNAACGVTNCHGMDVTCGSTPPMACTMEYQIGDGCRKYARCEAGSGTCRLVIGEQYTACRSCVERCQIAAGPDNLAAFSCAEKC